MTSSLYDSIIEHFKTSAALARALGIEPQAVYQWGGEIPESRAYQIEAITGGKFIAADILGRTPVNSPSLTTAPNSMEHIKQ